MKPVLHSLLWGLIITVIMARTCFLFRVSCNSLSWLPCLKQIIKTMLVQVGYAVAKIFPMLIKWKQTGEDWDLDGLMTVMKADESGS